MATLAAPETPDARDVRAFCAVVDLGSITAAARRIGETKGNVSRRISRLEAILGVTLVRRGPRAVQPTEEGARYREAAGRALAMLDEAANEVHAAKGRLRGRLRVTAPTDLAAGALPEVVARFGEACPEVRVEVVATDRTLDVEAERVDVALRIGKALRASSLRAHKLCDLELGFFASPSYLARHGAPRRVEALGEHRLLVHGAFGDAPELSLARASRPGSIALAVRPAVQSEGAFVRELALVGGGIALLPTLVVARDVAARRLVRVLADHRYAERATLTMLYPAALASSPKVRAFLDVTRAILGARRRRG